MVQIRGHKADSGWWDGPQRYEYVNRNMISAAQRETTQETLTALFDGKLGLNIGASGHARNNFLGVNIDGTGEIAADARDMPFADSTVAYIFCHHAIEHIPDPQKLVAECMRVLEHGGIFYCVAPDRQYFSHANDMPSDHPFYAPSEMAAEGFKKIITEINIKQPHGKIMKELLFNTRNNNFEWNYMGKVIELDKEMSYNSPDPEILPEGQVREKLIAFRGKDDGWGGWTSHRDRLFLCSFLQKVNKEFQIKGIVSPQIAEIGVFMGGTSMMFLLLVENSHLYAIDDWSGTPYDPYPSLKEGFLDHLAQWIALDRITIMDTDSKRLGQWIEPPLDLVYIDGDHSFAWTKSDIDCFVPAVKPGGYILIDDYQPTNEVFVAVDRSKLLNSHKIIHMPSLEIRYDGLVYEKLLVLQKREQG